MSEAITFKYNHLRWITTNLNQWVWISGIQILFFPTQEAAIKEAYRQGFEKQPIFVKKITREDSEIILTSNQKKILQLAPRSKYYN